jgi:hypothetical protein
MKLNTRYVALAGAVIGTAALVSYAVADPGRGHAYGHSQAGTSVGATSGAGLKSGMAVSGAQLASGDGAAAPTFKNGDEFFTPAGKVRTLAGDFVSAEAGQTVSQKNDQGPQFLNSTGTNSNATVSAGSATTATSKPTVVIDAATHKPDWVANASSGRDPKSKPSPMPSATPGGTHSSPSPMPSATPGGTQSSPVPKPTGTPYPTDIPDVFPTASPMGHIMPPGLTPTQPSIDPPPDI